MKKALVVILLSAGIGAVAFASFNNKKKTGTAVEKKAEKKECSGHKSCIYSL